MPTGTHRKRTEQEGGSQRLLSTPALCRSQCSVCVKERRWGRGMTWSGERGRSSTSPVSFSISSSSKSAQLSTRLMNAKTPRLHNVEIVMCSCVMRGPEGKSSRNVPDGQGRQSREFIWCGVESWDLKPFVLHGDLECPQRCQRLVE